MGKIGCSTEGILCPFLSIPLLNSAKMPIPTGGMSGYPLSWFIRFCVATNRSCAFFVRGFGCALFYFKGDNVMLKRCSECGKKVSTNAVACPHCGNLPHGECIRCMEYQFKDEQENPICGSNNHCCPAYVFDDPSNIPLMRKLHRKTPYDQDPRYKKYRPRT